MMDEVTIMSYESTKTPKLFIYAQSQVEEVLLSNNMILGRKSRSTNPDIDVKIMSVSRFHGEFTLVNGVYYYEDKGSTNGSIHNGIRMKALQPEALRDGDVIKIHGEEDTESEYDVVIIYSTGYVDSYFRELDIINAAAVSIGRDEGLLLESREVSRKHASFFRAKAGWSVIDNDSKNGVFVNGVRIEKPVYLQKNDVVRIANYNFIFLGEKFLYQCDRMTHSRVPCINYEIPNSDNKISNSGNEMSNLGNEIKNADKGVNITRENTAPSLYIEIIERSVVKRFQKKPLLKDINIDIPAGNMVLILGGSGAGKTTFMNAVMGYEKAKGSINYKGLDIYKEFSKMQYEIGYVPQEDLVRKSDCVKDTIINAAVLKLDPGREQSYYTGKAMAALDLLGLSSQANQTVGSLSGGQIKRLSIAMEYVGNPSLFFLDEPDSGLDNTNAELLLMNLRKIADEGKIVIFISHSPDRVIDILDKIIVLAKDTVNECGRLVFYGSPKDALEFFDVDSLNKIVKRINMKSEGGDGMADMYIEKFEKERKKYE